MKRWIALFLAAFLLFSVLPVAAANEKRAAEPEDLWETIARIEAAAAPAAEKSVSSLSKAYAGCMDQIIAAIEASDTYKPGTLCRKGSFYFWETTTGFTNGYSPEMRAKLQSGRIEGADPKALSRTETVSFADKGGSPVGNNVAVFQPYYGFDSNFGPTYPNQGLAIAAASGGTCTTYYGKDATITAIANALQTCGTVLVDSHGSTDAGEYVEWADTSYICLKNADGITAADTERDELPNGGYVYHAIIEDDVAFVDGTAIANHMARNSPNSMLWSGTCLGMATDGIARLHELRGVEVVYGYSRSVTFSGDLDYLEAFFSQITDGKNVRTAAAYMKDQVGNCDPYGGDSAYPIFVTSEDAYPGQGNVDAVQTVKSTWTLFGQPAITTQPKSITVEDGRTATLQVKATGSDLSYRWQKSTDGGATWSDCTAAHSDESTFYFFAKTDYNGWHYRCKVSNSYGTVYSAAAKLTVTAGKPVITENPASATVAEGRTVTLRVRANGKNLSYRWQKSTDGGATWSNCTAAHSDESTFYFFAKTAYNGWRYRCKVSNSSGTVYSSAAKLTVTAGKPVITENPASATVAEGKTVTLRVRANGENLSYRWQKSTDGGATWSNCTAAHSDESTFYFFAKTGYNGWRYRCRVSNSYGTVYSAAAKLTVTASKPVITENPASATVAEGRTVTLRVRANGENLSYRWQKSTDGGATWSNCTAAHSDESTFYFFAKTGYNGWLYRCKVYNTSGTVYSSVVRLTVT